MVLLAALVGLIAGGAYWLVHRPPEFYRAALRREVTPERRDTEARKLVLATRQLQEDLRRPGEWTLELTDDGINSWLETEFGDLDSAELPPGISDPRVRTEADRVLLGFRYDSDAYRGVVSLAVRFQLRGENRLEIEIVSLSAGSLPIPLAAIVDQLDQTHTDDDWTIQFVENERRYLIVVEYRGDASFRHGVEKVALSPGTIRITGHSESASLE